MHAITRTEAQHWCTAHLIRIDDRGLPQPDFTDAQGLDFKIPADTGRRIALLRRLFACVPADQELLLWFNNWGVWPSGERPHMFERFRSSYGEHRWLSDAPAYVFAPVEREDAISFAAFAILFLWDCHVLTASADTWLFLSHDEVGWVCSQAHLPPPDTLPA